MQETRPPKISYDDARENGENTHRSGWHKPGRFQSGSPFHHPPRCGCELVTEKGAYRDETYVVDGATVHYYHQSPVVVEVDGRYRLDNCGYQTSTTKDRINDHLPRGYHLIQRDFEWYIKTWDPDEPREDRETERIPFENGMVIEP